MSNASPDNRAGDGAASGPEPAATEHLARKAHDTIDCVASSSAEAETKLREQAESAADRIRDSEERARAAAGQSADRVSGYIQENPLKSAGIAFAAGVVLSGLLRL